MSHSFENFMGNKGFHPASWSNQKKLWEAEQRQKQEVARQDALRQQYIKEQERYQSKELIGKSNPLNFMYDAPPGLAKEKENDQHEVCEDGMPRLKLLAQREDISGGVVVKSKGTASSHIGEKGKEETPRHEWEPREGRTAPRQDYAKGLELRDQPFGIEVRNMKCFKCGRLGHVNTDKICPLYGQAKPRQPQQEGVGASSSSTTKAGPLPLPDLDMVEDGLIFKQCVREAIVDSSAYNQQILASEGEEDGEGYGELLEGFSKKERKRILRKLKRMEKDGSNEEGGVNVKTRDKEGRRGNRGKERRGREEERTGRGKTKKRGKKKNDQIRHHRNYSSSDSGSSNNESDSYTQSKKKMKRKHKHKSESDSESLEDEKRTRLKRKHRVKGCHDESYESSRERTDVKKYKTSRKFKGHLHGNGIVKKVKGGRSESSEGGKWVEAGKTHHQHHQDPTPHRRR